MGHEIFEKLVFPVTEDDWFPVNGNRVPGGRKREITDSDGIVSVSSVSIISDTLLNIKTEIPLSIH